jgi:hypothetical protein
VVLANVLRLLGRPGTVLALIALAVACAGFAIAANPSADGTVTACVNKKTKVIRLASSKNRCKRGERKLRWNQRGRPGQAGAPGQPGLNAASSTSDAKAGEVTTTSNSFVVKDGPTVTVDVPPGGSTILFGAAYDGKATGGALACIGFFEGSVVAGSGGCVSSVSYTRHTAGFISFADAGTHTYTVMYESTMAGQTASYQNRVLTVSVVR